MLHTVPTELILAIATAGAVLGPEDYLELSRSCRRLRSVLSDSRGALFESLIQTQLDQDLVRAYRTPFPNREIWGPVIITICGLRRKESPLPGTGRSSSKSLPRKRPAKSPHDVVKESFFDLKLFESWIDGAFIQQQLLESTVLRLMVHADRSMAAIESNGGVLLSSSWAATVIAIRVRQETIARMTIEVEEQGADASVGVVTELERQKGKMMELIGKLRVHALRLVILLFAITCGSERLEESPSPNRLKPRPSVESVTSDATLNVSEDGSDEGGTVEVTISSAPTAPVVTPSSPPTPFNPLALVHVGTVATLSMRKHTFWWTALRQLDTDTITGLHITLQAAQEMLSQKLIGLGMQGPSADLAALHLVAGPVIMKTVLAATDIEDVKDLASSSSGPYFVNAVLGVLEERQVGLTI
ncbi:hypothetical protein HK101_009172 [Irineochytrium annulatum]|nr:hypothetical protein HK101_009172 [Irineochytrium annulatum]